MVPNTATGTEKTILTIPHSANANHNGGMLAFGTDGYLYIGVGDGGGRNDHANNAQNFEFASRQDPSDQCDSGMLPYSIPPGNWFCRESVGGRDEIYAFGMRNPWRFSFDRQTGEHWVGDVGQSTREEVDTPILNGRQLRMARL